MNTCIKCGCDDAYPSLPPCPSPTACPNPPECAEVYPAECVVLSLANITCGTDVVVFQGDSIVGALENIVNYFCQRLVTLTNFVNAQLALIDIRFENIETDINDIQNSITNILADIADLDDRVTNVEGDIITIQGDITTLETTVSGLEACCDSIGGLVQSVTGLDTNNTDPLNPVVRISVDNTTITGLGTPASPLVASTAAYSNLQKEITTTYVLTDADNDYTIFINNGATPITISLGAITIPNFTVGFIQEGSADVTFSGVGLGNPIGFKLKGQGYQAFIERKLATATYYLLGNTKA